MLCQLTVLQRLELQHLLCALPYSTHARAPHAPHPAGMDVVADVGWVGYKV